MSDLVERAARYLAGKGEDAVAEHRAITERAAQMLAAGEVVPSPAEPLPPAEPFAWQLEETDPAAPRGIWMAAVEDSATGEGITGYFLIGLFHSEAEVRRRLAMEVGVVLAEAARVGSPTKTLSAQGFFASERLIHTLLEMDQPRGPGSATYFARSHLNCG